LVPVALFSLPVVPSDLTILITESATNEPTDSTSTKIPFIVAPVGIEKPKFVALR